MLKLNLKSGKIFYYIFGLLVLINIILLGVFLSGKSIYNLKYKYPELSSIENKEMDFSGLSLFFSDLANEKGGRYAFGVLKVAKFNSNIDLHLLGHTIGDVLYKQEGISAITFCDNDFRNACSHSVVIGIFNEKGEGALPEISEACKKAPGGSGAYTMCFHGLGHGILSYEGYDMEKASKICQKTGTAEYGYNESSQCISGTVMEIISGGFHDRETWQIQRDKYLNKSKPLALCQSSFIPNNAKSFCYDYLTPFLFEAVGADMRQPTEKDFIKAFEICDLIPENNIRDRDSCFGGFGKEFDGLVQGRDIRQGSINNIKEDKLKQIYDWCLLANDKEGINSCIKSALRSLYWGGENDRRVSINFCSVVSDQYFKDSCFRSLVGSVSFYIKDKDYRESFCAELPEEYKIDCKKALNIDE